MEQREPVSMGVSSSRIPHVVWLDCLILCGIAVILGALHYFVGDATRARFIFVYGEPTLTTLWTAAFFHDGAAHLSSNLGWYGVVIGATYFLYLNWEKRRQFWLTFGVVMLLTPPVATGVDYWLLYQRWGLAAETATAQGFSGVVSAFGGMLFITLGAVIADQTDWKTGLKSLLAIAFVTVTALAVTTDSLTPRILLLLCIGGGGVITLFVSLNDTQHPRSLWARLRNHRAEFELVGLCMTVFIALIVSMFPSVVTTDGRFVNVLAHGVGLVTGMVIAVVITIIDVSVKPQ